MSSTSALRFRADGTFKIVQFTDLHIGGGNHQGDEATLELTRDIISKEQPDLVVYTGDLLYGAEVRSPLEELARIADIPEQLGVPFAVIYGNHDSESDVTREELQRKLEGYRCSASQAGLSSIHGVGNYCLSLYSALRDEAAARLYFFDSGEMAPPSIGGYAWIHTDQVGWYREESERMWGGSGDKPPALAFLHIPLPEYMEAGLSGGAVGVYGEDVCCPRVNSGLFAAMLESGDVMGVFAGHDHDNDYVGEHCGIKLGYGRITGYAPYGSLRRGARIIELAEGARAFKSWVLLDDGSRLYEEEQADAAKLKEVEG